MANGEVRIRQKYGQMESALAQSAGLGRCTGLSATGAVVAFASSRSELHRTQLVEGPQRTRSVLGGLRTYDPPKSGRCLHDH